MRTSLAIAGALSVLLSGCGATVGDACTTGSDCGVGSAQCLNRTFAPGGYCSRGCKLDDASSCPIGTTCVRDALMKNAPACFRLCDKQSDCRQGYTCHSENNSPTICVGPAGL